MKILLAAVLMLVGFNCFSQGLPKYLTPWGIYVRPVNTNVVAMVIEHPSLSTNTDWQIVSNGVVMASFRGGGQTNLGNIQAASFNATGQFNGSGAGLTTLSADQLSSGTVPDARFPATLPALSGANLTSLNGSQVLSGTVPAAQLGSGASIGTKFLRGDSSWQIIPGGGDALTTSPLSQFAATTSAQLRGVLSDETGTGVALFDSGSASYLSVSNLVVGTNSVTPFPTNAFEVYRTNGGLAFSVSKTNGNVTVAGTLIANTTTVTGATNSALVASRVMLADANKGESSVTASGAVPIDADGTATTFVQVNALAPSNILTNGSTAFFSSISATGTGPTTIYGSAGLTNYIAVSTLGTLISNVFGAVFNNKGIYISNNAAALAVAYDATSGSLSSAGSNFLNLLVITNFATVSNQLTVAAQPDFRQVSPLFTTNASFTWATPNGFDATGNDINYTTITVTNNSGSAITMTGPANYNLVGTNSINAGGVNEVRFKRNAGVISNWYSLQDR